MKVLQGSSHYGKEDLCCACVRITACLCTFIVTTSIPIFSSFPRNLFQLTCNPLIKKKQITLAIFELAQEKLEGRKERKNPQNSNP